MTQLCFLLLSFSFFPFLFFLFEYLQSVFSVFFSLSWRLACCILGSRPLLYRHHNIGHHCPFGLRYKIKFQQQQQLRPTRWGFGCKISLKAPFRSYKSTDDHDWPICCSLLDAESTGFGPKRLRCGVQPLFPIEHGWTSGHVLVRTPVTWLLCLQATTYSIFGRVSVTRVESWCEICRLLSW